MFGVLKVRETDIILMETFTLAKGTVRSVINMCLKTQMFRKGALGTPLLTASVLRNFYSAK